MTRVLESMQAMMAQHKSKNSIPQEIETSGTQSTQEEDTPTPRSATKITSNIQARNYSNYKNVKNARKNRKRKLNTDWNMNKRNKSDEKFEIVAQAEVEVVRHNPEVAGRVVYSITRPHHSNQRGMYQIPASSNK
ncbi:hypothetical protein LOD99_1113 [Oopsacas minuta]|nr:hypothetical protein LOD99_1113 [Oopsacas minuta]